MGQGNLTVEIGCSHYKLTREVERSATGLSPLYTRLKLHVVNDNLIFSWYVISIIGNSGDQSKQGGSRVKMESSHKRVYNIQRMTCMDGYEFTKSAQKGGPDPHFCNQYSSYGVHKFQLQKFLLCFSHVKKGIILCTCTLYMTIVHQKEFGSPISNIFLLHCPPSATLYLCIACD